LASAASCLSQLTNPLNVSLLTTQLLAAPTLWNHDDSFRLIIPVLGTFKEATLRKLDVGVQTLSLQEWIEAVVIGADERVPRWKQLLASAGILCNFSLDDARLPFSSRAILEAQICDLVNTSLEVDIGSKLDSLSVTNVVERCYEVLNIIIFVLQALIVMRQYISSHSRYNTCLMKQRRV